MEWRCREDDKVRDWVQGKRKGGAIKEKKNNREV